MRLPHLRVRAAPRMARLFPSEPQPVKYTSPAVAPRVRATSARALFRASSLWAPGVYRLEGLAQCSAIAFVMVSITSGFTMVVAALSK